MRDPVLITGAAGFIGRHLTAALVAKGHSVIALDLDVDGINGLPESVFKLPGDIRDITHMKGVQIAGSPVLTGVRAIVHLAAVAAPRIAEKNPALAWSTNVQGTYNVLRLAQAANIRRVIFFSTAHVYGISPKYFPTDETHPLALQDTYTSTKIAGEALCDLFFRNYGISYTILRLFNGYGFGQSPDYFIGAKIEQARTGKLTMPWQPDVTKDWVHVSDIVDATLRALETEFVGPINVGTGTETRLGDIVRVIAEELRVGVMHEKAPFDEGPTRMRCDWRRAESILGWKPKVKFVDGLVDLIRESK